jgi:hypothetical protein
MTTKIDESTRQAIAAYSARVTQCPPGQARAKPVKAMDDAARWLKEHRRDPVTRDPKAVRRRQRMQRALQERVAKRNAAVRKRIEKR